MMNKSMFDIGTEVFTNRPFGFTVITDKCWRDRGRNGYWEYLVEGSNEWIDEDNIAFAHFDSIEDALNVDHIYHPGFVAGPGDPVIMVGENLNIEADLGNCIEINIPHLNIFRTHLDSINYENGICLSLIANEYLPHHKMQSELTKDEFNLIVERLNSSYHRFYPMDGRKVWDWVIEQWNAGDIFNPNPDPYYGPMPEYNYETITRRN